MKALYFFIVIVTISSCRIDELVLSGNDDVSEYKFTNAQADIDSAYYIDESLVNLFPLTSDNDGDIATIWALYLGDMNTIDMDTVILYCHGNGEDMDDFWGYHIVPLANVGAKHRYGILALDYRGFGNSEGEFTTGNFTADMNAVLFWLKEQGVENDRLIIMGNSLGAMPAIHGATRSTSLKPHKMILDAPFPGVTPILQGATGLSLDGTLLSDFGDADNAAEIQNYDGSLLWFHCKDDETVPFDHAKTIYDNFQGDKRSVICETGNHNPMDGLGMKAYLMEVDLFIKK